MAGNNNILGEEENMILADNIKLEDVDIKIELKDWVHDLEHIHQQWELMPINKIEDNTKEGNKQATINLRLDHVRCSCKLKTKNHSRVTRAMIQNHKLYCLPIYN